LLPARLRIHLPPERRARFHELARERDATRPFEGKFESWTYAPIYVTGVVASAIRRALHLETKS
jgi:mitochondrial fission protein ELM1